MSERVMVPCHSVTGFSHGRYVVGVPPARYGTTVLVYVRLVSVSLGSKAPSLYV